MSFRSLLEPCGPIHAAENPSDPNTTASLAKHSRLMSVSGVESLSRSVVLARARLQPCHRGTLRGFSRCGPFLVLRATPAQFSLQNRHQGTVEEIHIIPAPRSPHVPPHRPRLPPRHPRDPCSPAHPRRPHPDHQTSRRQRPRVQTSLQRDLGLRRTRIPREQKLHAPPGPAQKSRLHHPGRSSR